MLPSRQLVDSGLAAPAPLAFNLSSINASLLLDGCTLTTSCDNLAQFAAWVTVQQPSVNHHAAQVRGHTRRTAGALVQGLVAPL